MGLAEKINPGFAYFDKPWLFGLLVGPLMLLGLIVAFIVSYSSCQEVVNFENKMAQVVTDVTARGMLEDIASPPCDGNACNFVSFSATVCITKGRRLAIRKPGSNPFGEEQEVAQEVCRLPSTAEYQQSKEFAPKKYTHKQSGGLVTWSGITWCEGAWESEQALYDEYAKENGFTPYCGNAVDGSTKFEGMTFQSGPVLPYVVHYQYSRKTVQKVCPTVLDAVASATALIVYIELFCTALIAVILIPTGMVKARAEAYKKHATVCGVIKSGDGMMCNVLELKMNVDELMRRAGMEKNAAHYISQTSKVEPIAPS